MAYNPLTLFAARVTRHPSPVQMKPAADGTSRTRVSVLLSVYGEVDPNTLNDAEPKLKLYAKPVLVSFMAGENSELFTKHGITKGTTLYMPATGVDAEPAKDREGKAVTAQDGTPIHHFVGEAIGKVIVKEAKKLMAMEVAGEAKATFLTAEAQSATRPSFLQAAKNLLNKGRAS